jgi:hypothetical protein
MAQQEDSPVMLRAAKHLDALCDRPFAALRVTPTGTSWRHYTVMLSRSEASRRPARQTLRCAQGGTVS